MATPATDPTTGPAIQARLEWDGSDVTLDKSLVCDAVDTVAEDVAIVDVDEVVINQGLDHSPSWQDHGGH